MHGTRSLTTQERLDWLRLARTPNIGPVTFAQLIEVYGAPARALQNLEKLSRRGGGSAPSAPSEKDIARELDKLSRMDGHMLASCDADFPSGLAGLGAPPPVIMVLGQISLLRHKAIAIVGARNASALGRKFAENLARDLSAAGLLVVSGLARGIDTAAHEGAFLDKSQSGGTAAVLAGGVDILYPPENAALYDRLCRQGAVISEMPMGMSPLARHFPRRNRIISGMARGVVVVEAAEKSGSLITANYALEQGREIFAVPGSPLDPRAKGANRLIRDGATLIESVDDILAVLDPMLGQGMGPGNGLSDPARHLSPPGHDLAALEREADLARPLIEEALGPTPIEVDELVRRLGIQVAVAQIVLLELELAGRLTRDAGNKVGWA